MKGLGGLTFTLVSAPYPFMKQVIRYKTKGWSKESLLKCVKEANIKHFKITSYSGGHYLHIYEQDISKLNNAWQNSSWSDSKEDIANFNPVVYVPSKRSINLK